ncbi:MAG: radical SAM protein [bacterium]
MAKILFVTPGAFHRSMSFDLPLGLLNLAAILQQAGHQAEILDFNALYQDGSLRLEDDEAENLAAMRDLLLARQPDLLGFSTFCSTYHISLLMARAVKEERPGLPVILGGPQASLTAEPTLQAFIYVDAVAVGETEETIGRIVAGFMGSIALAEVPGLAYREGESIRLNAPAPLLDLKDLPAPDYRMASTFDQARWVPVETGRGCPYNCRFCSTRIFWRHVCRPRDPASIAREMARIYRVWGRNQFIFVHDLFTSQRQRVIELCDILDGLGLPLTWSCSARLDTIDEHLAARMVRSGCRRIFLGLESGSPRVQAMINKPMDLEKGLTVMDFLLKSGVETVCSLIAGFPGEKEEDLRQTLSLALRASEMGCEVTVNRFTFLPQTELTEEYQDRLVFDGSPSNFGSGQFVSLALDWIRCYPQIFPTFYTVDDPIRRKTDGLDRFFSLFFLHLQSCLPDTWRFLLERWNGDLLDIFLDFQGLGLAPHQAHQLEEFSLARLSWAAWTGSLLDEMRQCLLRTDLGHDGAVILEMFRYERDRFEFQHGLGNRNVSLYRYQADVPRAKEEGLSLKDVPLSAATVEFHREEPPKPGKTVDAGQKTCQDSK